MSPPSPHSLPGGWLTSVGNQTWLLHSSACGKKAVILECLGTALRSGWEPWSISQIWAQAVFHSQFSTLQGPVPDLRPASWHGPWDYMWNKESPLRNHMRKKILMCMKDQQKNGSDIFLAQDFIILNCNIKAILKVCV